MTAQRILINNYEVEIIEAMVPYDVKLIHQKRIRGKQMMGKNKQIRLSSVANQEPDVNDTDSQKLYDGFVVMARIIAKEMAKEIKIFTDSTDSVPLSQKLVLSSSDAAKLMGVHVNTILRWVQENKIPSIKYGRKILIPQYALKNLLNGIVIDGKTPIK
jgi:excisionase family DNA binding protein